MASNETMENVNVFSTTDGEIHILSEADNQEDASKIAVVVMLIIFSFVGVVGNAIAFYIFFARRSTSTSVIFILALAGTDFFTCLVTIPYTIVFELLNYYLMYDMACKTYMFLITSTVPFSAYIMVGIALDRYFCICHPFLYVFTLPRAKAVVFCMGIPAVVFGIITALSYGANKLDPHGDGANANITLPTNSNEFHYISSTIAPLGNMGADHNLLPEETNTSFLQYQSGEGHCVESRDIISEHFLEVYKKIHALNFLVAYLSVAILYVLIYKSIFTRRANKVRKRKENNVYNPGGGKTLSQEETQLTVINGGDCNSPNVGKDTRKDVKCPRKIASASRNEPSMFNNADTDKGQDNNAVVDEKEEERINLLDDNHDVWSNETNGNSSNVSTCNTTTTPCGLITETDEGGDDNETFSVYVGPQTQVKKFIADQNIWSSNDNSINFFDAEAGEKNKTALNNALDQLKQNESNSDSDVPKKLNVIGAVSPTGSAPEEKPLLPHPKILPATPPNSLALSPNMTKIISSQTTTDDKQSNVPSFKREQTGKHTSTHQQSNSVKVKRNATGRDRTIIANVKTAFMLFIVTLVFIIAFLPALLMAHRLISFNMIIFYGYFIYNVANPFIYAFMNQTFREDLKKIVNICQRRIR